MAEQPPEFSTRTIQQSPQVCLVRVSGDLDVATSPRFKETLDAVLDTGSQTVLLDLEGVDFLDSTGISAIVVARRSLEERGASLSIDGLSPAAERVLEIAGLLDDLRHKAD